MKVLITGGDGVLATCLKDGLKERCKEVICLGKKYFDVTNYKDFDNFKDAKIDYVLHFGAMTNIENCEKASWKAYLINHTGTMNAVQFCANTKAKLILIGTTNIFDGTKHCYKESDTFKLANPQHVYGRSKYYGECSALYMIPFKTYVLRAGWLVGGGYKNEKKFVRKIVNELEYGKPFTIVSDIYGSLTFASDIARMIDLILDRKLTAGIYNVASHGIASRFEIAKVIADELRFEKNFHKVKQTIFKKPYVQRIPSEVLDLSIMEKFLETKAWTIQLKEYLRKEYKPYVLFKH